MRLYVFCTISNMFHDTASVAECTGQSSEGRSSRPNRILQDT